MTDYFYERQIPIFDYPRWAQPLRDAIRENMERLAAESRIGIEVVSSSDPDDGAIFRSLGSGEFNISGFQNKDLRRRFQHRNSSDLTDNEALSNARPDQKKSAAPTNATSRPLANRSSPSDSG